MQTSENDAEGPKTPPRGHTKPRSRSPTPRSNSPGSAQLSELLRVRKEHSFTRRMKSFNKDRNPDLGKNTPSHRRQTCSSLIKRNRSLGGAAHSARSRRTISMGGASLFRSDGDEERPMRRAHSSMGKARGKTAEFELNDQLGFFVADQMPEGCEWLQGNSMEEWLASQQRQRRGSARQSRQKLVMPRNGDGSARRGKNGGRRSVNSVQSITRGPSRSGGSVRGGIQMRIKPRGLQHSSSGPSDRKSDSANNMSSGKLDDADLNLNMTGGRTRSARPRSAAPLKQTGATGDKTRRTNAKEQATKKNTSRNSLNVSSKMKESQPGVHNVQNRPKNLDQKNSSKAAQCRGQSKPKNDNQTSNDESRTTAEPKRTSTRVVTNCEIEEEENVVEKQAEEEKEEEEAVVVTDAAAITEESSAPMTKSDAGCSPITEQAEGQSDDERQSSTTCTADDVSAAAPIGLENNPFMQRSESDHSEAEYCDAFSKSCHSSKDSGPETQAAGKLAESLRSSKKSFTRENTFDHRSGAREDTERSQVAHQPNLEDTPPRKRRMTLVERLRCCRFPIKSCFCGVNVSPGPQNDNDLRHSVALYD